jgi:hypothetical protein
VVSDVEGGRDVARAVPRGGVGDQADAIRVAVPHLDQVPNINPIIGLTSRAVWQAPFINET